MIIALKKLKSVHFQSKYLMNILN